MLQTCSISRKSSLLKLAQYLAYKLPYAHYLAPQYPSYTGWNLSFSRLSYFIPQQQELHHVTSWTLSREHDNNAYRSCQRSINWDLLSLLEMGT